MKLESPNLAQPVPGHPGSIEDLIRELPGSENPYAIASHDELTYAQVLWIERGFLIEYQDGSIDQHYRSIRHDFSAEEIIELLSAYVCGDPNWASRVEFERVELRSLSFRMGRTLGKVFGRLASLFR